MSSPIITSTTAAISIKRRVLNLLLKTFLLSGLLILAACANHSQENKDVPAVGVRAERLNAYFEALETWGFSGAVLVAEGNEVVLAKGYGMADRETGKAYSSQSVQTVGSITKQFTGAAVLKLEAEGLLSVDDRLADHFNDVPDDKAAITLHHLLTHSAGFPGAIGDDFAAIDREAYVEMALEEPLLFEPGTSYEYSNVGFSLLAALVERISGQSYEAYLREALLVSAKAEGVGYLLPDWKEDQTVTGYRDGERWGTVLERPWADDGPYWNLRGNGGLHASAWDMYRWFQVVRGESEVLPGDVAKRWTNGYVDEGYGDSFYGYGWAIHDTPWGTMVAHNGGNMIFAADFFWLVEKDLFIYVASNSSYWRAPRLREEILSIAFDEDVKLPWKPDLPQGREGTSIELKSGKYETSEGGIIEVSTDGPRLRTRAFGQSALGMLSGSGIAETGQLEALNQLAIRLFDRLQNGVERPFDGVKVDPRRAERSATGIREFLEMASGRLGPLDRIDVVGSIDGTNLMDIEMEVSATTWLAARFEHETRALGVLWDPEGSYLGTSIGPVDDLPSWIFAPAGDGRYIGWMPGRNEQGAKLHVEDEEGKTCLVVGEGMACGPPQRQSISVQN